MTPAKLSRHRLELRDGNAGGIEAADQRACRCSGNRVDGNCVFFKRAQYAYMRNASRRAAGKRQADARTINLSGLIHSPLNDH